MYAYICVFLLCCVPAFLLREIVHGSHEVHYLKDVEPHEVDPGAPGHIVGFPEVVFEHAGGTTHEVVKEVVHDLDEVHHGLGALDDLSVQRGLDVGLKKGKYKILF